MRLSASILPKFGMHQLKRIVGRKRVLMFMRVAAVKG